MNGIVAKVMEIIKWIGGRIFQSQNKSFSDNKNTVIKNSVDSSTNKNITIIINNFYSPPESIKRRYDKERSKYLVSAEAILRSIKKK